MTKIFIISSSEVFAGSGFIPDRYFVYIYRDKACFVSTWWDIKPKTVKLRNMLVKISLPWREGLREGEKAGNIKEQISIVSLFHPHPVFTATS
jgi:hypothetical protein